MARFSLLFILFISPFRNQVKYQNLLVVYVTCQTLLFFFCSHQLLQVIADVVQYCTYALTKLHRQSEILCTQNIIKKSPILRFFSLLCPVEILSNIHYILILSRFAKPYYNCQSYHKTMFLQKNKFREGHILLQNISKQLHKTQQASDVPRPVNSVTCGLFLYLVTWCWLQNIIIHKKVQFCNSCGNSQWSFANVTVLFFFSCGVIPCMVYIRIIIVAFRLSHRPLSLRP